MKSFSGKVAAITGAGSGIGQATAIALAKEGCHLAISDISEESLEKTVELLAGYAVNISTHVVDVSNKNAVYQYAEDTVSTHGKVNLIMNNAGVGLGETVENMSYENFEWLMNINFWGVVHGTKAFLPFLKASGDGHVVNVSSVFGIIAVPSQGAYNAAKFAVKGFTECLREELALEGSQVQVTCIHPGGIKTNIVRNSRIGEVGLAGARTKDKATKMFDKAARTSPPVAAQTILNGVRKNKPRVLIGPDARVIDTLQRLLPTRYQNILVWGARRNHEKYNA